MLLLQQLEELRVLAERNLLLLRQSQLLLRGNLAQLCEDGVSHALLGQFAQI